MTTKASVNPNFKFNKNDTILFGRESAGVPENVHQLIKNRLKIPMEKNKRSLNIASSVAIILAESLKTNKMDLEIKKDLASNWFKLLQDAFCNDISILENNKIKFKTTTWRKNLKKDEGGGEYRIIKDGKIFEKVGVNFSKVYGKFPKKFQKNIPGANKDPRFWASGISVVMHMKNPLIPAMHFNTRYVCTSHEWFGGGMDVTPSRNTVWKKYFHKTYPSFSLLQAIIKNIKNGAMNIFIFLTEKSQEV